MQLFDSGVETGLPIASASNSLGIFLLGLLLLPSAVFAFMRITGQMEQTNTFIDRLNSILRPGALIYLFPITLVIGSVIITQADWTGVLLPPLLVIGAGLPILWLLWLGKRQIPAGSPQLQWGVFSTAVTLGPFVIIVIEVLIMVIGIVVGAIFFASQITEMGSSLPSDPDLFFSTPEAFDEIAAEFIQEPIALFAILFFISFLVPLIEELFKPIAVWILAYRKPSPSQGFTAGLISGAAFALFENFTRAPTPDQWILFVIVRIGASLMHILNSGLMGWAIASAFSQKRYFRLLATYILTVLIHGLWNAAPVFFAFSFLDNTFNANPSFASHLIITTPLFLLYLTLASFLVLVYSNRQLVKAKNDPDQDYKSY